MHALGKHVRLTIAETVLVVVTVNGIVLAENANDETESVETDQESIERTWQGHFSGSLGVKQLKDVWSPAEDMLSIGIESDFARPGWPTALAVGVTFGYSRHIPDLPGVPERGSTNFLELLGGVRKLWMPERTIQPFMSGGVSLTLASTGRCLESETRFIGPSGSTVVCVEDDTEDGFGLGAWVDSGLYLKVGKKYRLGFRVQYSAVKVELVRQNIDAGGFSAVVLFGKHFKK